MMAGAAPSVRDAIRRTILGIDEPFDTPDLFRVMEAGHGIADRTLILRVLHELFMDDAVRYADASGGIWAFEAVRRPKETNRDQEEHIIHAC